VSNFNEAHIEEIKAYGLPLPDANQIELHPWSQKPGLVSYLRQNGISVIAYSSLVPLSTWRDAEGQRSAKTEEMKADGASEGSPFKIMAKKYDVTEAQVLLRWALQNGYAVLPKSTSEERIRQNFDLFSFEIDNEDMAAIAAMDRGEGVAWSAGDPLKVT
jgi:2,5-diketo-D-gluconate reductase A